MSDGSKDVAQEMAYTRVVGLDLSDRTTTFVELAADATQTDVLAHGTLPLTEAALRQRFADVGPYRIALEVGTHSPWVSRLLTALGHAVIVANPRQVALIFGTTHKTDRQDAEHLARLARSDPKLLRPIRHRSATTQADLTLIRARAALVAGRTDLVNHVRGALKALGLRIPRCSTEAFPRRARTVLAGAGVPSLLPLLVLIAQLTKQIKRYDRQIAHLAAERYPVTDVLQQVPGVGPITALTFVLTLEDPRRFARSRDVGPYLGLTRREDRSGNQQPELAITKAGDSYLRALLVQAAHHHLGPFGPDTRLRRWGLAFAGTGSRQRKKKAVVAVARKLGVLLHHRWVSGEVYEPLHVPPPRRRAAA